MTRPILLLLVFFCGGCAIRHSAAPPINFQIIASAEGMPERQVFNDGYYGYRDALVAHTANWLSPYTDSGKQVLSTAGKKVALTGNWVVIVNIGYYPENEIRGCLMSFGTGQIIRQKGEERVDIIMQMSKIISLSNDPREDAGVLTTLAIEQIANRLKKLAHKPSQPSPKKPE